MGDNSKKDENEKIANKVMMSNYMYFAKKMSDYVWAPKPDQNWPDTVVEEQKK